MDKRYLSCPGEDEWMNVEALVPHLWVFYEATVKLSGSKCPTLNIFFPEYCEIYLTIQNMSTSPYPFIVAMSKDMLEKWDKYWCEGSALLSIACVLDPRCKVAMVEYYFKMIHPNDYTIYVNNLKIKLDALFKYYEDESSSSVQNQPSSTSSPQATSSTPSNHSRAGLKSFLSSMRRDDPIKIDLEEYLADPLDQATVDGEFDILSWWRLKAPKYPILARVARDIMAVSISTVVSKSTFSIAGRVLSPIRSSLNNESLEALICAQDWLHAAISEKGVVVGDVLWSIDEAPSQEPDDDTICGTFGNDSA